MTSREQFCPAYSQREDVTMKPLTDPDIAFYKSLYSGVGEDLRWRDRLLMPEAELKAALSKPGTSIYVLYVATIRRATSNWSKTAARWGFTISACFRPITAWGWASICSATGLSRRGRKTADRVWVHTCNLDSPHALDNYLKRGFQIYKVHRYPMPERYILKRGINCFPAEIGFRCKAR